ncbi:DeoR family transcriptional regulator [Leifsonia sp. Leaf325]|nr:DeoR/GlpR family DNA-binding transcription regulator [Leifsonia sp. Leaf325]KQQ93153.1 DeoR family transcriptional regulator [Leifsonia sp. Leaf325]
MLAAERRDFLVARLERDGKIVAKDLARELGISDDSMRRDLRDLAAAGLSQRVYGGALPVSPAIADYATRGTISVDAKARIGRAAAELIRPGATVILDGGTTALAVARALPGDLRATIVTHSPTVASALIHLPDIEIFMIGGRVFKHSAVTSGAAAAEAAAGVNADLFLLGVTGVHAEEGLTTDDADEAAMKRLLSRRSAETWVLASSEKIGAASRFAVLALSEVAGVITDAADDDPTVTDLRGRGLEVLSA